MGINYLDIAILVLALILGIVGYCVGFLRSLTKLMGSFLSLILAIVLCKSFAVMICNKTPWDDYIVNGLNRWLTDKGGVYIVSIVENASEVVRTAMGEAGIPKFLINWIAPSLVKLAEASGSATLAELLATYITNIIMIVCSVIVLFIVIRLAVYGVNKLIGLFLKDKLLKLVDRIFGIAFGFVKTALVVFVCLAICGYFIDQPYMAGLKQQVTTGKISKLLYENNPVETLLHDYVNVDGILRKIMDAIKKDDGQPEESPSPETPEVSPEASPEVSPETSPETSPAT